MEKREVRPVVDSWGGVRKGTPARASTRVWLVDVEAGQALGYIDVLAYVETRFLSSHVTHGLEFGVYDPDQSEHAVQVFGFWRDDGGTHPESQVHRGGPATSEMVWNGLIEAVNKYTTWQARPAIWNEVPHTCQYCGLSSYGRPCGTADPYVIHVLYCTAPSNSGVPVGMDHTCDLWIEKEAGRCESSDA